MIYSHVALPGPIGSAGAGSAEQQWRPSLVVSAFHSPMYEFLSSKGYCSSGPLKSMKQIPNHALNK
jgi:hypothetical protein